MNHPITFLYIAICSLLLSLYTTQAAAPIGSWFVKGYYAEGDSESGLSPLTDLTGSAEITSSSLSLQTNKVNMTFTESLSFSVSDDKYTASMKVYFSDENGNPSTDPSDLSYEFNVTIRVIDENTLVLLVGDTDYGDRKFSEFVGAAAVLTKTPYAAPTEYSWTGSYSSKGVWVSENSPTAVNLNGVYRTYLDGKYTMAETGDVIRGATFQESGFLSDTFTKAGNLASVSRIDTGYRLLWEDDAYKNYNLDQREYSRILHLGDGRALAVYNSIKMAEGIGKPYDPGNPGGGSRDDYVFLSDAELWVTLLETEAIGRVTVANGNIMVNRGNKDVPLIVGSPLYEKDKIKTGESSFVRILYNDKSIQTIGRNSTMEIQVFKYNKPGVVSELRAYLRKGRTQFTSGDMDKSGIQIKTKEVALGVRGTIFTLEYEEDAGIGTSTVEVTEGIVDMMNLQTSVVTELNIGESDSVVAPVENATLTLNFPTPTGGHFRINGQTITSFPHVASLSKGTQITLEAVRDAGYVFAGWTGDFQGPDSTNIIFLDENMTLTGAFETYTGSGSGYEDLWADTGYSPLVSLPDEDANQDGVANAVAYAFGIPPAGFITQAERALLPAPASSITGGKAALKGSIPVNAPDDAVYCIEVSETMADGSNSWTEIARKEGNDAWTGTVAAGISTEAAVGGYVPTLFEFPASYNTATKGFLRMSIKIDGD